MRKMDRASLLWITIWIVCGLFVFDVCTANSESDREKFVLGTHMYQTCREDNVTFTWEKPANVSDFTFMDLIFVPDKPSNDSNRMLIFSLNPDNSFSVHQRYKGRLRKANSDKYSFELDNVNPRDRGQYELHLITSRGKYTGLANLVVYAEDNLWPLGGKDDEEQEEGFYRYPFIRQDESPVIGVEMSLPGTVVKDTCFFGNLSRCEIIFTVESLESISGTVFFDVVPLFMNNTVLCHAVKKTYDYKVTMMRAKLSSALVGGICISVFIAIAACVIPPVIIHIKNKEEKKIPLKRGYDFIKGCIERIEETQDISDVYRKNANSKMIHPHVKGYFQDPKARECFFQDEGLTKIYFAAFIKYYIANVCEPLISTDYIKRIKNGDVGEGKNISYLRDSMRVKRKDSKSVRARKRILKLLFQHFHWFRQRKIEEDGSDSEEQSPSKILTTTGLAGFLAMNFDRTKSTVDLEEFERLARLTRFLKVLIINSEEIFGSRDEANGNIDGSMDLTLDPLLQSKA